jgi:PAS domain S-box-containing protein
LTELTVTQLPIIESIFAGIALGIVAVDIEGTVLFSNQAARDMLGIGIDQVPLEEWIEHYGIHSPDRFTLCPASESRVIKAISGQEPQNLEVLIRNKLGGGRSLWCSIDLRPLRGEDGEITGSVLLIQDISMRKKLSDEVSRSNAALQQFATVAAHDLQEPLRSIAGFADMLALHQGDQLDEKSARCLTKMKDGIKRMQALINDLLNYSRIQTKPQVLTLSDCNEILESCIRSLNGSIRKSEAIIEGGSLPTVMADYSQLSQLFQNLVGNALKFSATGRSPVVRIAAKQQGSAWLFSVEDNGIGIAPEFSERIFGVFQRLHPASTYSGTGIGLAICQMIVDRHGGRIWVESQPEVGSKFFFTIPATMEDRQWTPS